jgi:hypothetical protein
MNWRKQLARDVDVGQTAVFDLLELGGRPLERPLLYRGIRQEQSYFISLFLPRLGRRRQMTSRGSCFSSRSAPGRLMMGLEGRGGSIFGASLPMMVGRVCGHYELTSPVVPVRTPFCRSRTR